MDSTEDATNLPPANRPGDIEHTIRLRMRAELADLGLRRGSWRILRTLAEHPSSIEQLVAERSSGGDGDGGRGRGFRRGRSGHGHSGHGHFGRGFDRRAAAEFADGAGPDRFDTEEERAAFIEGMRAHRQEVREAWAQRGCAHHSNPWHGEREHTGHDHPHHDRHDRFRAHRIQAVLGDFAARGWVTFDDGVATLTDEGRTAYESAAERIRELLASVATEIK